MADKLFRDYFNEKTETGSVPAGGKLLVQTGGATEPKRLDVDLFATVANSVQKTGATDQIVESTLQAEAFIKAGGTSSEFLKADGSVDSTSFLIQNENLAYGQSYLDNFRTRILNDLGTSHPSTSAFELANLKQNDLLQKASLIVTPSATKASKLYAIKPQNAAGDLTVVRATTATRVNEDGLIESVAANVPRVDYKDGAGSILVEPQRTNLLLRSEEFDNAPWSKTQLTVSNNTEISPNGTLTADTVQTTGTADILRQNVSVTSGNTYTASIFLKNIDANDLAFVFAGAIATIVLNIDLVNKTASVGVGSIINFGIENYQNDWVKVFATFTVTSTDPLQFRISSSSTNLVSSYYIWGAQLEAGSNATSYIPTVASTVTRNADVISKTGISDLINSEEGVLYAEISALSNDGTNRRLTINQNANNRIGIEFNTSNQVLFSVRIGGAFPVLSNFPINIDEFNKIAFKYKSGDCSFFLNGIKIGSNIGNFAFTENQLNILSFSDGGTAYMYSKIKNLQIYKEALTDQELAALTTL